MDVQVTSESLFERSNTMLNYCTPQATQLDITIPLVAAKINFHSFPV